MSMHNDDGLSLLEKGKIGLLRVLFGKMGIVLLLLALQLVILFGIFLRFEQFLPHIYGGTTVFTVIMVLYLINSDMDPTAKITWMVLIMLLPVFGGLLYLFTEKEWGHRAMKKRLKDSVALEQKELPQEQQTMDVLKQVDAGAANMCRYVRSTGYYPVYQNTAVTYFPLGEMKFDRLMQEMEAAKQYIYLEYFIIEEGHMWGKMLDVLVRKAAEGVDIRVLYDGTLEFTRLPKGYTQMLAELGIHAKVFSKVTPIVSTHYNYRDHRKIAVIDGHTAFTGGVNISDEYINWTHPYGHWKDTAVMLKGEAAQSFALMFLQMWNLDQKQEHLELPEIPQTNVTSTGFVMPYGESPLDDHKVGKRIYIDILNRAQNYVYIMTPYLIIDAEMENTLKYAAKRGIDVTMILPGIPDNPAAHSLARTHYKTLLDSGVKILEYTPGFVHAKVMVADDQEAVVGTINFDYRSLYHHFECATYLNRVDAISEIKKDFLETAAKCQTWNHEMLRADKWYIKAMGRLLKVIAPLM